MNFVVHRNSGIMKRNFSLTWMHRFFDAVDEFEHTFHFPHSNRINEEYAKSHGSHINRKHVFTHTIRCDAKVIDIRCGCKADQTHAKHIFHVQIMSFLQCWFWADAQVCWVLLKWPKDCHRFSFLICLQSNWFQPNGCCPPDQSEILSITTIIQQIENGACGLTQSLCTWTNISKINLLFSSSWIDVVLGL